jgi:hypothetical protein
MSMEEALLQKDIGFVVVIELSTTLLKMLDPVKAHILNLWRETFLYSTAVTSLIRAPGACRAQISLLRQVCISFKQFCASALCIFSSSTQKC